MRLIVAVMYALALCTLGMPATGEERAADLLAKKLGEFPGSERGQVISITEEPLPQVLPGHSFYALRFRQYPVALAPPEPLRANNLFAVKPDGTVEHVRNAQALKDLFRASLPPVTTDALARDAARAWLRLAEEFHQDGFLRFSIPADTLQVASAPSGGQHVTGKAVAEPQGGDSGEIVGSLVFDRAGKLVKATETANLKRGMRPICQATKLLDPDPIVRRMAEQDLLVMGKAAREYLDEQRATASPDLQRAIDRIWRRILAEGR